MGIVSVEIDDAAVQTQIRQRITELVQEVDAELVFWDRKELERRTCMSWNFIQDQFFFDPRFPKSKIGNKWYFPAKKTQEFLLTWFDEQRGG